MRPAVVGFGEKHSVGEREEVGKTEHSRTWRFCSLTRVRRALKLPGRSTGQSLRLRRRERTSLKSTLRVAEAPVVSKTESDTVKVRGEQRDCR